MMNKARFEFFFILLILFVFEMVVQTEGWICDGTAFTDLLCRRQCILRSNVWGTCTAFTSVSGKHLGWNCICRKYLD
ncbi:hypothetical protein P8452_19598 [Trifolium repens]|nr:hypothetical protein P8452_19598 [Trifolium repens]